MLNELLLGLALSTSLAAPVRTFHIGNSLTDTVDGWLTQVATAAGKSLDFHRFTIPGAPTDWLWDHPNSGFGDSDYLQAFERLKPIDHIFTQPFSGHDRSIENEAEYSSRFFKAVRQHSPSARTWLYCQWPTKRFDDNWSRGDGAAKGLPDVVPAKDFLRGAMNHMAYTRAVKAKIEADHGLKNVRIVPAGLALGRLRSGILLGRAEGLTDFETLIFSDDIHLAPAGRYLVSLVHYACIFGESPEGKLGPLESGLNDRQARLFQRLAWQTVSSVPESGVAQAQK